MSRIKPKYIWAAIVTITCIILITNGGIRHYRAKQREYEKLKQQVKALEAEYTSKNKLITTIKKDPSRLELLARRKLGLVNPDEIEFRFLPEQGPETGSKTTDGF